MDVLLNENQKMKDVLLSLKNDRVDSSDKKIQEIVRNVDDLYLTDFSLLDYYDLESNIMENAATDFDSDDIEINLSSNTKKKIQDLEDNWIPIVKIQDGSVCATDFAFNIESSEIQSIDFLTKQIQNIPFQVTYCSDRGKTSVSSEYGLYYEKEPEYTTENVYCNLDLKECLSKYLTMNPSFSFIREEKEEELEL